MRGKKAEGLSLTTVVIAALALLVLVVLAVIFVSKIASQQESSRDCIKLGGTCFDKANNADCRSQGTLMAESPEGICYNPQRNADGSLSVDDAKICCIKIK